MSSFSKLTPEKVYRGLDEPNWLSVNGGTIKGDVRVEGAETVTGNVAVSGNLTVNGTINGTKVEPPVFVTSGSMVSLTANTNVSVYSPSLDVPLTNGATYEVFIQGRARVLSGALSAGDSINLNITAGASLPSDPTSITGAVMQMSGITADVATGGYQYWNTSGTIVVPSSGTNYLTIGMLFHVNGSLTMSGGVLTVSRVRVL